MPLETIAFLYPGAMGASLARTLHIRQPQLTLLTSLSARSQITLDRASSSGLINVPLEGLVDRADVIISILPPSAAIALATEVVAALPNRRRPPPIYIDANAISPTTVSHLSTLLAPAKVPFIDGAVLGLPATDTFDPKIYLSSAKEWEVHMKEVVQVLGGDGEGKGLRIEVLDGAGEGAASALKMCYGGINKGFTGLAALMVLAAHAHSPGTADALLREFSLSQNVKLDGLTKSFPNMIGKAYRFVGEMQEVSSFIETSLSSLPSTSSEDAKKVADTYEGLAQVFQRIADDVRVRAASNEKRGAAEGDGRGTEGEFGVLLEFAEKGRTALNEVKENRT